MLFLRQSEIQNEPTQMKKKLDEFELLRLNSLGYSLRSIAKLFSCHPTTVTLRLQSLGVAPSDTRRTFMEDVLLNLPDNQVAWVENQLGPHTTIKEFVRNLITQSYIQTSQRKPK